MKKNCWLILGTLIATSVMAQVNTNTLPEIPAPASSADAATPPPAAEDTAAPATPVASPVPAAPVKKAVAKKTIKKRVVKKIHEPKVSLVSGTAVVTAHHLNVRGKAGFRGEVIGRLDRGETVSVISQINLKKHALNEPAQWAKISLPSGVKVWVSSHFVDAANKTVTAHRLNLRAGPGENYGVLGTIDHGTSVNEITHKGSWLEIQPPDHAYAYVAAMYLDQSAAAVAAVQPPPAAPVTPAPETPAPVATPTPAPVTPAPVTPVATPSAPSMASTQPPAETGAPAPMNPPGAANPPSMAMTPQPEVPTTINTNPPPPRVATHEGYVRGSVSPVAPTAYELYDPSSGNAINYLYSPTTNLDLSRYDGTKIIVTGAEGLAARWSSTPVLTVQRIYVVNTNPPVPYHRMQSPRASQKNIPGTKREKHH